ncbi:MAG TPA: universal stress protein [Methylomirabilota bacterium]|nr:universal stress protein [Methylomirabilota bacterium]
MRRSSSKPSQPRRLRWREGGRTPAPRFQLRRILVPVDFSTCSAKALEYAAGYASLHGATIELLFVAPLHPRPRKRTPANDLRAATAARTRRQLRALARAHIGRDISVATTIRAGRAEVEIIDHARETNVDLIILATRGATGIPDFCLGSTAETVVRYAPCPVLVVREQERDFLRVAPQSAPGCPAVHPPRPRNRRRRH